MSEGKRHTVRLSMVVRIFRFTPLSSTTSTKLSLASTQRQSFRIELTLQCIPGGSFRDNRCA